MSAAAAEQHRLAGNQLFQAKEFLKASAEYTKALRQQPDSAVLFSNRSVALLKLNKLGKALEDAERAIALDPAFHKAHLRKAAVLEAQGRLPEALECYRAASKAAGSDVPEYAAKARTLAAAVKQQSREEAAKAKQSPAEVAAMAFAAAKLTYAAERMQDVHCTGSSSSSFSPELHFLQQSAGAAAAATDGGGDDDAATPQPDDDGSDGDKAGAPSEVAFRAPHAFDAPLVLETFVHSMREHAQERRAVAAVLVAPKAAVAYPQLWLQPGWPYRRDRDGVFVQLQAVVPAAPAAAPAAVQQQQQDDAEAAADATCTLRSKGATSKAARHSDPPDTVILSKVWFVAAGSNDKGKPSEPVEVDAEKFSLLPPILRAA